ncbi:Pfam:YDG SRA [Geosmithia morbida]|uniref:Pfam:YDG SRA n=1 Tax=Geosmithia morbida TaxID=1094350 RepID=A0A9P5CZ81_9HYPO|nr:Pfam:YDG SRA [Geosmithia morbida]KAF4121278.1 Pfam:YDG SRA [Geosmithia morbida]
MQDMCLSLLGHIGRRIRVVRGPLLESMFAPKAGVRYDGEYTLIQYGQKVNPMTGAHRLSLVLGRVEGQIPMHKLISIPRPSQMDDWKMFEDIEERLMQCQLSEANFVRWFMDKAGDIVKKERFERFMHLASTAALHEWVSQMKRKGGDVKQLETVCKTGDLVWER